MNEFDYDNEIVEITEDSDEKKPLEEEALEVKPVKKPKKTLKDKWQELSRKQKGLIIALICLILLLIAGAVIYFVFFNKDEEEQPKNKEEVILEKDNYRYENGNLVFLNLSDREIGRYTCTNQDVESCYVAKLDFSDDTFNRIINVNEEGKELDKTSQIYFDKYVFVKDGEDLFIYNIETKEKDLNLLSLKSYGTSKSLVVVKDASNKYGLIEIDQNGYKYLINPTYDYLGIVNPEINYLIAKEKDATYVIDSTGKKLSSDFKNAQIMSVSANYVVAKVNESYTLYDYKYNDQVSDYDYIGLHSNVISLVKNNRLYLLDLELNKLNEDGIRLENKDYVKKYVYDNNNKLIETKKSYEIAGSSDTATITIGTNEKNININEGRVSKDYDYLSYFDGKLYFYSDKEKTDVIGTYTCINKNDITSSTTTLDNCSIYHNEDGLSGIYNNEYVFIADNKNDTHNYYLYDLKESKSRGTYNSLNFVKKEEINTNIKPIYTSSSYIIAVSGTGTNTGNYGVLEISSEKIAGKVEFKYKSIEKVYDYYLLINVDDSYSLYDTNFKKISNEFAFLSAYEKYYVGINNNKLNVYAYDNTLGILESDLEITGTDFKIDFNEGFNITIGDITYNYNFDGSPKDGE